MSWLSDILGNWKNDKTDDYLNFGRFSDAYKAQKNYKHWDDSLQLVSENKIIDGYKSFLEFLSNDSQNVVYHQEDDQLVFYLYQGSKKIEGVISRKGIRAEAKIAKTSDLRIEFLRLLTDRNYSLEYSRYALDEDNDLTIVFDTFIEDCSPFKLYNALKELAIHADKLDDILIDEFGESLKHINTGHVRKLTPEILQLKAQYVIDEISSALSYYEEHKDDALINPGGMTYVLLSVAYRIDYLTQPEGYILDAIERIQRIYFTRNDLDMEAKNQQIVSELRGIQSRGKEAISREFYTALFTFGITKPVEKLKLGDMFHKDFKNFLWYRKKMEDKIAQSTCDYIMGYILFNYAPPQIYRELLHFYFEIRENAFFQKLDNRHPVLVSQGKLHAKAIRRGLHAIQKRYADYITGLKINTADLDFESQLDFSESYFRLLHKLKFSGS